MSTTATVKITDGETTVRLMQHADGYPDFVLPCISEALDETLHASLEAFADNYREAVFNRYDGPLTRDPLTTITEDQSRGGFIDHRYLVDLRARTVTTLEDLT